jgi:sigma-B regulation protein RsbU (phosphoserine phosphatase)
MSAVPHAQGDPNMATALDPVFRQQLQERRRRLLGFAPPAQPPAPVTEGARREVMRLLSEVDAALDRLEKGTFGICEVCHDAVETERLLNDPLCRVCIDDLDRQERRALEYDLEMAGRIQAGLLPERDLLFDGWQVHCRYVPLGPVSGDYYDLVRPRAGQGVLLFGDVAGKGVAASLLMSHLHAIFRSLATQEPALGDMVARANHLFCNSTTGSVYATLVCGLLAQDGAVELVNAGHPPAFLLGSSGLETIPSTGLPVGLFCGGEYASASRRLDRGDVLLLYTDGVSEARNAVDEEFGEERVAAAVERSRGASAEGVVDAVLGDLAAFRKGTPLTDDVSVMALRRVA